MDAVAAGGLIRLETIAICSRSIWEALKRVHRCEETLVRY